MHHLVLPTDVATPPGETPFAIRTVGTTGGARDLFFT